MSTADTGLRQRGGGKGKSNGTNPTTKSNADDGKSVVGRARSSSDSSNTDLNPTPGTLQEEHFLDFLYTPHTIAGMTILMASIIRQAFFKDQESRTFEENALGGLKYVAITFLVYCALQLRDGEMLRPHPVVWRVIHGLGVLYLVFLVFMLCQSLDDVPRYLQLFDPRIGMQQSSKSYGGDCRLVIPADEATERGVHQFQNVFDQILDRFTIAHVLGWYLKALILRDWALMWTASVTFEVLEVSLQHLFPNFNECWWDHLFLDIFGCNFIGMALGMATVKFMNARHYDWSGMHMEELNTGFAKVQRVALQFTPYSWTVFRWEIFASFKRFAVVSAVLMVLMLGECNAFFLKTVLNIPIDSDVNLYRLAFWVLMTYMAVFEYFRFAEDKTRKIGKNAWLATGLVLVELLLVVKHANLKNMFSEMYPEPMIIIAWIATGVCVLCILAAKTAWWTVVKTMGGKALYDQEVSSKKNKNEREPPQSLVWAERILAKLAEFFKLLLPMPFILVLLLDCYRTMQYPPPDPMAFEWPTPTGWLTLPSWAW